MTGKINSIIRLRINSDGTGVRSVIFLQDCPLSCSWCCNPETRYGDSYKKLSEQQLYELVSRDQIYFDATNGGITFSGGEPLYQADFIQSFLRQYGENFNCNIETSLYASFDTIEKLIPYINEWYIDFKVFDENDHFKYTGVTNQIILSNIKRLAEKIDAKKIIITYPIIPSVNDSLENVRNMTMFLKENGIVKIELHPYRKHREKKYERFNLNFQPFEKVTFDTLQKIESQFIKDGIDIIKRDMHIERRKCETLKSIRRDFCKKNRIALSIEDCSYQGRCVGTCPKCESELEIINKWRLNNNAKNR